MRIKVPFIINRYRRTERGTFLGLLCSTSIGYRLVNRWCVEWFPYVPADGSCRICACVPANSKTGLCHICTTEKDDCQGECGMDHPVGIRHRGEND